MTHSFRIPKLATAVAMFAISSSLLGACNSSDEESNNKGAGGTDTGGQPGRGGTPGAAGSPGTGADAPAVFDGPQGVFTLDLVDEQTIAGVTTPAHVTLTGQIESGPPVPTLIWEPTLSEGGCTLLEPYAPFCEVDCGSAVCVADDVCRETPDRMDVGTVILTGVDLEDGGSEVELVTVLGKYQLPGAAQVSFPPAAEGTTLTLTADGVATNANLELAPAFTVETTGILPLDITSGDTVQMERDRATTITWTPPSDPSESRIFVEVDISHHGGQKGQIDCEAEDSGSLTIPARLVTGLINLGVAGFPDVKVARRAVGRTQTDEIQAAFRISSSVTLPVELPGFVSCNEDLPCPDGLSCNSDVLLCE